MAVAGWSTVHTLPAARLTAISTFSVVILASYFSRVDDHSRRRRSNISFCIWYFVMRRSASAGKVLAVSSETLISLRKVSTYRYRYQQ